MNTKSFVKILRKVVREEVRTAMKDMLNETPVTDKQVIDKGISLHDLVETQEHKRPARTKQTFTKNSMLNDILNETAATGDFASMHSGPSNYPTMGEMMRSNSVQSPLEGINGEAVDTSKPELQAVQKALTKDYSGLIKAINKKNGKMGV